MHFCGDEITAMVACVQSVPGAFPALWAFLVRLKKRVFR